MELSNDKLNDVIEKINSSAKSNDNLIIVILKILDIMEQLIKDNIKKINAQNDEIISLKNRILNIRN